MSKDMMIYFDDGREPMAYDDTYDILIHCDSEEARQKTIEHITSMQWIPVAERLPDMWDERYLVSLAWGGIGVMEYKSTGFHNYGSFTPVPIESILAWMPLPESSWG